jgi:hypothetical protein
MDVKIYRHLYRCTAAVDLIDLYLQQIHKRAAAPDLFDMGSYICLVKKVSRQ